MSAFTEYIQSAYNPQAQEASFFLPIIGGFVFTRNQSGAFPKELASLGDCRQRRTAFFIGQKYSGIGHTLAKYPDTASKVTQHSWATRAR